MKDLGHIGHLNGLIPAKKTLYTLELRTVGIVHHLKFEVCLGCVRNIDLSKYRYFSENNQSINNGDIQNLKISIFDIYFYVSELYEIRIYLRVR